MKTNEKPRQNERLKYFKKKEKRQVKSINSISSRGQAQKVETKHTNREEKY